MSIDKIAALGRTALFKELDMGTLRALAARAIERRFQKDELLFVAGEEAHGLYVVVEGAVRAFRESADGREQVIHVERAGATVAEVPVFDGGPFPSSVAAETDSTLLFINKRDVRNLCREHPQIALAALKVLAGTLTLPRAPARTRPLSPSRGRVHRIEMRRCSGTNHFS